ncbi:MAG: DUF4230 domain-containing protein [Bacteroidales bacterium]|nr:DUF4230 domain-containing protein [Bacteroidales bacterium]
MNRFSRFLMALALPACILSGCSRKAAVRDVASRLSGISEIGTVEYTVKKVISANDTSVFKIGDRKIYFTCIANVKAGIDLSGFSEEDIKADRSSKSVEVVLPHARILSIELPPGKIEEKYCSVTGFRWNFTPEEKRALLKQGEEDILARVEKNGILEDAERNSSELVRTMFEGLGFEKVEIRFE